MDPVYSQTPGKVFPSLFLWELPYQVCLVDYHCRITLILTCGNSLTSLVTDSKVALTSERSSWHNKISLWHNCYKPCLDPTCPAPKPPQTHLIGIPLCPL